MDFFEDLLERKHNKHGSQGHHGGHDHHDGHSHEHDDRYPGGNQYEVHPVYDNHRHPNDHMSIESLKPIIEKALQNKPLIIMLGLGALIVVLLGFVLLLMLLPLLAQILGFVDKNGIKGGLDLFAPILERVWNGQQ